LICQSIVRPEVLLFLIAMIHRSIPNQKSYSFWSECLPISCSVRSFTLSAQIHQSISPITLISGSSTNSTGIFQAMSDWEIVLYLNRYCVIQSCKGLSLSVKLIQSYSDRQLRIIILSPGKINISLIFWDMFDCLFYFKKYIKVYILL
jgi:hypothetical protein